MTPDLPDRAREALRLEAKHVLFAILGLLTLVVLYTNERFIVDHTDPLWSYYLSVRWLLLPHGIAGAVVLCLGASQFSTRLRQRHPRVHRILGRLYLIGVAIAATVAICITLRHNPLPLEVAIITQALLWMLASGTAFYCVRHGNFVQHRHWMIRSYAITLIFVFDRVLDAIPGVAALDTDTNPTVLWLCNVLAWVAPTFIVGWSAIVRPTAPASNRG